MIQIKGRNGVANVYANTLEATAEQQIINMMNQDWIEDQKVAIMPDVHAGAGGVIGLTIKLNKLVVPPSLVGSDIGCGVTLFITDYEIKDELELAKKIDEIIINKIPTGPKLHDKINVMNDSLVSSLTKLIATYNLISTERAFGTLGGGNHFIEAYNHQGKLALSVHTGSRTIGGQVYKYWKNKAEKRFEIQFQDDTSKNIEKLKAEGREKEIQDYIEDRKVDFLKLKPSEEIPILENQNAVDYMNDVIILTEYAFANRKEILYKIIYDLGLSFNNVIQIVDKPHNYIEKRADETYILRKGSQSGYSSEQVLIPINMRDGMIIGTLSNSMELENRNWSAPHGAGRVKSRTEAKATLSLEQFAEEMKDVHSSCIGFETLDEAPGAYKTLEEILEQVQEILVSETLQILKPFFNAKGGKE